MDMKGYISNEVLIQRPRMWQSTRAEPLSPELLNKNICSQSVAIFSLFPPFFQLRDTIGWEMYCTLWYIITLEEMAAGRIKMFFM